MELSVIVPCYNERAVLSETVRRLVALLESMIVRGTVAAESRIYFIDDGSSDQTWRLIEQAARSHALVKGIKLSRNCGHQLALLAGLLTVPGDIVVSVDADLQDDLDAIHEMIREHKAGADIVFGVRSKRDTDTLFKRLSAELYYRFLRWLNVDIIFNHADYRLMSRRSLAALAEFKEVNIFLRGIIPQLGFPTAIVYFERRERFAGETKYPLKKMLALAWNGVTSFSAAPLRFITAIGIIIAFASFAVTVWAISIRLFTSRAVPGWASTVVPMYFLGGIQLLSIGIVGEYVAKIYSETKRRPRYIIEKQI